MRAGEAGADGTPQPAAPLTSLPAARGSLSVGVLLGLLIAVIILPALIFSLILLQRNNAAQQELVTTLAEATAGSIVESVDRQLLGTVMTLRVLSTAGELEAGDLAGFQVRAQPVLDAANAYLSVLDAGMNQIMNTRVPFGTPLQRTGDPEAARRALETGRPVISDGFIGPVTGRWVFNAILPLERDEEDGPQLLVISQHPETLAGTLARRTLGGGWNAALIDTRGTVLASTLMLSHIGHPFYMAGLDPAAPPGRQNIRHEDEDYVAFTNVSNLSGWHAVVWAPTAIVNEPMTSALRMLALGGAAMMAIGAFAAWLLGGRIARSVRRLADDARRLGAGEDIEAVAYRVREIDAVSDALARASQQRSAAENEIRFLMREVAHRSKNQLTVVSSIAKQTARNAASLAAFEDSFQKRLQGLARSTDLLVAGGAAGVELRALIAAQIEPFRPADEARFAMEGPRFRLSQQAAQTLGLALHELATNAAKYGAFLVNAGRLSVRWKRSRNNLEILWREHVPGLETRPPTRGFGTEVIERMLGAGLDAQIERTLHADGLECRFVLPVARLAPER